MTTPQNPGKRRRQKSRRAKQLSAWRAKHVEKAASPPSSAEDKAVK
jgi:hypothetical protein